MSPVSRKSILKRTRGLEESEDTTGTGDSGGGPEADARPKRGQKNGLVGRSGAKRGAKRAKHVQAGLVPGPE